MVLKLHYAVAPRGAVVVLQQAPALVGAITQIVAARPDLHAIDAAPSRVRRCGSYTSRFSHHGRIAAEKIIVHLTHCLIHAQALALHKYNEAFRALFLATIAPQSKFEKFVADLGVNGTTVAYNAVEKYVGFGNVCFYAALAIVVVGDDPARRLPVRHAVPPLSEGIFARALRPQRRGVRRVQAGRVAI